MYSPSIPPQKPPAALVQRYANGLTVSADHESIDAKANSADFRGHVVATYGPTTVTADRMFLQDDPDNPSAEAIGHVVLTDPEGTIHAASLQYNWRAQTGHAQALSLQVSRLALTADSADITPGLWTLRNVGATGCKLKTPLYYIHVRELQVRPGVGMRAQRIRFSILGQSLGTFPVESYSFTGPKNSLNLPYPTTRSGSLGVNWTNEFEFGPSTALYTKYAVFEKSLPFYNGTLMQSMLKGVDPESLRTEIGDRFTFGYFDSAQVRTPKDERNYFSARRFDLGVATTFGADAQDTTESTAKINKPAEVLGQASGNLEGFGVFGLFRAQEVQVGSTETIRRLILEQNLLTPALSFGKTLSAYARADAAEFTGGNQYSWVRGQVGVVYHPAQVLRFGASYTAAKAFGTPAFAYDEPLRFREVGLRADLDFDTTQIRFLAKYDPSTRTIFDREFYISRVMGCIEPFVVYRERPHKLFLGIMLPINRVFDQLSKDELARRAAVLHTVSGPP